MALPDFLIIGAMKSGTSSLHSQLAAQPGVFMSTPKEPNFFSDDDVYAQGLEWYEALFDAAGPGDLKGESSTHYTKLPTHPDTLARMVPVLNAPKLIYVLRDPLQRAISHYMHSWSEGQVGTDMAAAFATRTEFAEYSLYSMQIAPYIAQYGAEAVCLTSLERIKSEPEAELARIGAFLGLPDPAVWQHEIGAQNVSAERFRPLPMQRLLVDNPVAEALRRSLVPKSLRDRIRRARSMTKRPEMPAALAAELNARFAEDCAALITALPEAAPLVAPYGCMQAQAA